MHQVVESLAVLQQVVDSAHHTENSEREDVDTDNGDDGCLATNEPTKNCEHSRDDVDGDNGAGKLPTGDRRPERSLEVVSISNSIDRSNWLQ